MDEDDIGIMMDIDMTRMGEQLKLQRSDTVMFNMEDLKKDLQHVMDQYIYNEGEFCVNISALTRRKLIRAWRRLDRDNDDNMNALHIEGSRLGLPEHSTHRHTTSISSCRAYKSIGGIPVGPIQLAVSESVGMGSDDESNYNFTTSSPTLEPWPESPIDAIKSLPTMSLHDTAKELYDKIGKDNDKVGEYLRIFDDAMEEIIELMRKDSLLRFYDTMEYETMCRDRKISKA